MIGNGGLGIDVGAAGVTPNDPNDQDGFLNTPRSSRRRRSGADTSTSPATPDRARSSSSTRPGRTRPASARGPSTSAPSPRARPTTPTARPASATARSPARPWSSARTRREQVPLHLRRAGRRGGRLGDPRRTRRRHRRTGRRSPSSPATSTPTPAPSSATPVVHAGANATLTEGDTFAGQGSFTDLDSTSWTATVDYGDGSGARTLTINPITLTNAGDDYTPTASATFSLQHVFPSGSDYTVTVAVTDDAGDTGFGFLTVHVAPAPPTVDNSQIQALADEPQRGRVGRPLRQVLRPEPRRQPRRPRHLGRRGRSTSRRPRAAAPTTTRA